MEFAVIIPTYNGVKDGLENTLTAVKGQNVKPARVFVIDSSSSDGTAELCKRFGCTVHVIDKKDFNHGLTRQLGIDNNKDCDIALFLTQDCVPADNMSFSYLLDAFKNSDVSAAYGRQAAHPSASLLEKISRSFNYPDVSFIKSMEDRDELGIYTPFCSDSFAAYMIKDLLEAGGFPDTDFAEDMLLAAKLLMNNKKIAYVSEAKAFHSHKYSVISEFKRGLSIGKIHKKNRWLPETFGKSERRGYSLIKSVPFYLRPLLAAQAFPKYAGYKIGAYIKGK